MKLIPVHSSNISAIGYENNNLFIKFFRSGKIFKYNSVLEDIYTKFLSSESKGKFFHAEIKDKYTALEVKK